MIKTEICNEDVEGSHNYMNTKYSQHCGVFGANAEFLFVMRRAGPAARQQTTYIH